MDTIITILQQIPITIWSALIAAAIALLGVRLANSHSRKIQSALLNHQSEEKEKDRKLELRREIYLDAAEQIYHVNQHLVNLGNIDIADENPANKLEGFFVAANKVLLVASDESVTKINDLLEAVNKAFLALLGETKEIQDYRIERNIKSNQAEQYFAEVQRINRTLNQLSESGNLDQAIQKVLADSYEFNSEQSKLANDAAQEAWKRLNELKTEFSTRALVELEDVARCTLSAQVVLRKEMGLSSNIFEYQKMLEERMGSTQQDVKSFLNELED